ncbi:MAG: hypothetical protein WDN23_08570 [Edaphobacter sp.]
MAIQKKSLISNMDSTKKTSAARKNAATEVPTSSNPVALSKTVASRTMLSKTVASRAVLSKTVASRTMLSKTVASRRATPSV